MNKLKQFFSNLIEFICYSLVVIFTLVLWLICAYGTLYVCHIIYTWLFE